MISADGAGQRQRDVYNKCLWDILLSSMYTSEVEVLLPP